MPSATVTQQCGIPTITTQSIELAYDLYSKASACASGYSNYYANAPYLNLVTVLYSDTNGTYADAGWYSNGTIALYWDGTVAQPFVSCFGSGIDITTDGTGSEWEIIP